MTQKPIVRTNISERIAEIIRDQIFNLVIEPGARLMLEEYAQEFGVSRTPVRDALKELSKEGIVVYDGKSYYVRKHTLAEIEDIFLIRRSLEITSVEQAALRRTQHDLDKLNELCEKAEFHILAEDLEGFINYDKQFHNFVATCSQNARLLSLMTQFNDECWWINKYIFLHNPLHYPLGKTFNAHKEIIAAIAMQDCELAVQLMKTHIVEGESRKLQTLRTNTGKLL